MTKLEHLDAKKLLTKATYSADKMMKIAGLVENGKIDATTANALTNAYRSAGNLYISIVNCAEGAKILLYSPKDPVQLSPEDKARLDQISKLLQEKPSKRAKKVKKK